MDLCTFKTHIRCLCNSIFTELLFLNSVVSLSSFKNNEVSHFEVSFAVLVFHAKHLHTAKDNKKNDLLLGNLWWINVDESKQWWKTLWQALAPETLKSPNYFKYYTIHLGPLFISFLHIHYRSSSWIGFTYRRWSVPVMSTLRNAQTSSSCWVRWVLHYPCFISWHKTSNSHIQGFTLNFLYDLVLSHRLMYLCCYHYPH